MVVNIPHAVNILHMQEITARVNDHSDRLDALRAAQAAGDAGREPVCPHITRSHGDGLGEIEPADLPEPFYVIECLRQHYRVKCHRKPRRRADDPIETTKDIAAAAAQCPMFQLEIDRVVVPDLATDRLDVSVAKSSDAAVGTAQQKLVQLEHGHVKNVAELSFETAGVGGDAAQIVVSGNHGESGASAAAGAPRRRSTGRGAG